MIRERICLKMLLMREGDNVRTVEKNWLRYMIHIKFIFVYSVREGSGFFIYFLFTYVYPIVKAPSIGKTFSPLN